MDGPAIAGSPAVDLSFSSSHDSDRIQIAKLLKYAQRGNPTATMLALASLRDVGLHDDFRQAAVLVSGTQKSPQKVAGRSGGPQIYDHLIV